MALRMLITARNLDQVPVVPDLVALVEERGIDVQVLSTPNKPREDEVIAHLPGVDVYVMQDSQVSARALSAADRLRVISRMGSGLDEIDLQAATERGIVVCNAPAAVADAVAEFAVGTILAVSRKIVLGDRIVRAGGWSPDGWSESDGSPSISLVGQSVAGKRLGIIGLGHIGRGLARKCLGLEMEVVYFDVRRQEAFETQRGVAYQEFDELLRTSDYVAVVVPLSPRTRHLMGREQFRLMKNTAFLVNVSRGGTVDQDALCRALEAGELAGAALDVFEEEPLSKDHPLIQMSNVVLTPHMGGGSHESINRFVSAAVHNALEAVEGKRPATVVNPEVYDVIAARHAASS